MDERKWAGEEELGMWEEGAVVGVEWSGVDWGGMGVGVFQ